MKPTMRDVAKKANVSLATVSRALSGKGYIKEDTMDLVIKACRELAMLLPQIANARNSQT